MDKSSRFLRFPKGYRIEHWVLAVDFIVLAITGLSQLFYRSPVSQWIIASMGGVENVRIVHHVFAMILIIEALFHIGVTRYRAFIRLAPSQIVPQIRDIFTALQAFGYNLGFTKNKPLEGRYTFAEKAEYWAVVWGTVIMAITGFMMWNPVATARLIPGDIIVAGRVAHGLEAILAVLAIIVWHFYFVLVKNLNMSMFTGYISEEHMREEHPLELADIRTGKKLEPQIDQVAQKRFWRFCFPQYAVIAVIFLAWAVWFAFFEQTSVEEIVPAENVIVFSPVDGEFATAQAPLTDGLSCVDITWDSNIGDILQASCASCHGPGASRGLNFTDYQAIMASGAIVPGYPDSSPLILELQPGDHPGELAFPDLALVHIWISHGAPEYPGETITIPAAEEVLEEELTEEEGAVPSLTWATGIGDIFEATCISCHGQMQLGGLDLSSYGTAMDSGVIVPGSPERSDLIIKMEAGGHPAHLSPENLEIVRRWIQNGAPSGEIPEEEPEVVEEQVEEVEEQVAEEPVEIEEPEETQPTGEIPDYFWDTDIQPVFENRCSACHGDSAMGGLDLRTYASLMDSDVVVPADPDSSLLITKIEIENHPGTLTPEEISMIRAWIWNGAMESQEGEVPAQEEIIEAEEPEEVEPEPEVEEEPEVAETQTEDAFAWADDIQPILETSCLTCHGSMAMGGLDMSTYESLIDSGVVEPGNPDDSLIVIKMVEGGHPAQLSEEELEILMQWIADGAVEGG